MRSSSAATPYISLYLPTSPLHLPASQVGEDAIEQHGDSELWRHSRLRWLDSTAGEAGAAGEGEEGGEGGEGGEAAAPHRLEAVTTPVEAAAAGTAAAGTAAVGAARAAGTSMGAWDAPVTWEGGAAGGGAAGGGAAGGGARLSASGLRTMGLTPLGLPSSLSVGWLGAKR